MKHNFIRYSMIVLLIGLGALTAGQSQAQGNQKDKQIELLSFSWGIAPGQTARVSMVNFGDGSVRFVNGSISANDPVIARIQLLDTEGEVLAQSDEIKVALGQTRFWDVPRDQIQAEGDPRTGRIQVRTRILVTTKSFDLDRNRPPLAPTMELINPSTGETTALNSVEWVFVA